MPLLVTTWNYNEQSKKRTQVSNKYTVLQVFWSYTIAFCDKKNNNLKIIKKIIIQSMSICFSKEYFKYTACIYVLCWCVTLWWRWWGKVYLQILSRRNIYYIKQKKNFQQDKQTKQCAKSYSTLDQELKELRPIYILHKIMNWIQNRCDIIKEPISHHDNQWKHT